MSDRQMDTKERKHIIRQIGLLEIKHCDPCDKQLSDLGNIITCKDCPVYHELRVLGDKLGKHVQEKSKAESAGLTIPAFIKFRMKGYTYEQISMELGIKRYNVADWYRVNKAKIEEFLEG